jgi:hypothetical protein
VTVTGVEIADRRLRRVWEMQLRHS